MFPLTQPFSSTVQFAQMVAQIESLLHNERAQAQTLLDQLLSQTRAEHDAVGVITAIELQSQITYGDASLDLQYEGLQMAQTHRLFAAEARLLNLIGRALYASARYQEAMQIWARCLEAAELSQQYIAWVKAKMGLGQIYDALGDHQSAVQMHQEAIARCGSLEDDWLLLQAHINLGVNLFKLRRHDEALAAYNFALDTARTLKHADDEAEALMRIGELYVAKQSFSLAMASLDAARVIAERTGYRWALAQTILLRAECLLRMGRPKEALQQSHQGLDIAKQAGALHVRMKLHYLLSEICETLEDFATALQMQRQAQRLEQQIQQASQRDPLQQVAQIAGLQPNAEQTLLNLASSCSLEQGSLPSISLTLCQTACQILQLAQASFWQWADDGKRLICLMRGNAVGERLSTGPDLQREQLPELFTYLQTGEMVVAHSATQHLYTWRWSELTLQAQNIHALILVPVRLNDQTIAVLACEHLAKQRNWQRAELQHANQLGLLASRALAQHQQQFYQQEIAALNTKLQGQNDELELRVAERTQALQDASQKLVHAEKLAALGFLVAGFAHKLNTPLGSILTAASTFSEHSLELGHNLAAGSVKKSQLEQYIQDSLHSAAIIQRNAHRASEMIRDLRQLADDDSSALPERCQLKTLIEPIIERWQTSDTLRRIQISNLIDPQLEISSYRAAIEQIIGQLLENSLRHAFGPGQHGQITLRSQINTPDQVQLVYQDNGKGIAHELQPKIFEPFYTTQFGQGHSGLGMYQVYSLIHGKLGGDISLRSEIGQGVEITLTLPIRASFAG
ncbi:GAF domain-containing protein [Chitinibacter fontanus]|uniref:histidine kinase n=1 Tax=Chitinibacter fontanus TaxID=1737446 RepID=A0A7D5V9R1_9NEIS|nr:ATP-binding protein [Chitinibacter fontanus]QLI81579.1 GAF domain-containing protein [Chitinibacter fontanus]